MSNVLVSWRRVSSRALPLVLPLALALPAGAAAAQGTPPPAAAGTATVTGQVTDSASGAPLANVEVFVAAPEGAPTRGTRTGATGRYTLTGVPAGTFMLRARLLGYGLAGRQVTVREGETATANFALVTRSVQLDQVVVTGTGGVVQRRAVGNVVESIKAEEVMTVAPVRSVEQLVGSRTPGVIALPATGQIGTGAQLRIRGVSSLSLSNDPLIYIDGVRMDAATARGPGQRGGAGVSRLNDVNPEDIESIEIIKGPAASTLYGTEASNGVIQIITKRGRSGQARFDFTTRQGTNWMMNPEGRAGMLYAPRAGGGIDSVNLYRHEAENGNGPIFTNGRNQGYLLSMNGGTDANRYFMSTAYDHDVGIVPWNWDKKFSARANLDVLAGNKLRLQGNVAHIRDRIRLAQGAINIDPFSQLVWGTPRNLNGPRRGFSDSPPEIWRQVESHADNDRTTISLTGTYTPWSWFSHRLVTGLDVGAENNWTLYPRLSGENATLFLGNNALGQKNAQRANRSFLTLDYAGSAKWSWRESLEFTSSVGLQHYRSELSTITATASVFPASPITTVGGGADTGGDEAYTANATVGLFVQQAVAWNNRVFLTAALRGDDNSTFGKEYSAAYYPKLSASWVVSEEPWFRLPGVAELRLRGAFGAAGTQPGTFDAARLYDPVTGYQNQSGLSPFSFGNPQLRPERSQELELGFETGLLDGRADVQYTYYTRRIKDAIVNAPLPPSLGFPGSQVLNIGRVNGWGHELAASARVVQMRRVGWELGAQIATNGNRIIDMGGAEFLTVGGGGQAQNRVGFSIADMFLYKVLSARIDDRGNVLEAMCDGGTGRKGLEQGGAPVPCAQAPRVLWGHTQPTWQLGVNSTVTLFNNLRLYARVEGNGGHVQSNTEIRALHNQGSTLGTILRNDPFLQVYRAIEADAPGTYEAGFLRLREISASYNLPGWLSQRVGATAGTLSLAGRNLMMLWTAQNGWGTSRDGMITVPINNQHVWDPEIRAVGQLSNGFQTILPPTASVVATLRLSF